MPSSGSAFPLSALSFPLSLLPSPPDPRRTTVRHVYNQTHRDFYSWKPPSTLPMETGWAQKKIESIDKKTVQAHKEFGRKMALALGVVDGGAVTKPVFEGAEKLANAKRHAKAPISWNNSIPNPPPPPQKYVSRGKVRPLPRYFYCVPIRRSLLSPDVVILPFIPTFTDDVPFDADAYAREFPLCAWELPGRNGDTDIILRETAKRCRAKGLSARDINKTRVLPKDIVDIEMLDLMRDLPAFPSSPETYLGIAEEGKGDVSPAKRKWEEPLEVKQEEYSADPLEFEELCCHNPSCTNFMCVRHSALFFDNMMRRTTGDDITFAEDKLRKLPRLQNILLNLNNNCSGTCYSLRISELLTETEGERQSHPRKPWTPWDRTQLFQILKAWTNAGIGLCALRDVFDRPCDDVAMEVVAIIRAHPELQANDEDEDGPKAKSPSPTSFRTLKDASMMGHVYPTFADAQIQIGLAADTALVLSPVLGAFAAATVARLPYERARMFLELAHLRDVLALGVTESVTESSVVHVAQRYDRDELLITQDVRAAGGTFGQNGVWEASDDLHESKFITCGNVALQKGMTPKMRVGISDIAGYGLFAGQDIPKDTMIGEYVGELITDMEGNARNTTENIVQRRYQFQVNGDSIIDAAFYGNLTRFFNSDTGLKVNCVAEQRSVDHETRILFTTLRTIKRNEEILFNYGQVSNGHEGK
ncbi:hypothetical protein L202_06049 [Cryptococcus amylolentus CBS 6039]|uniref:SET domain-containing protein n=1 Tax=Cryptococcus amylolentus CBS 6039 TaxID=1295533 RepID=A0A1E3HID4_9TREE|nr:hypothetical protein L202_06049 [Cryptococcus amylolentus CBS 6039]ODN76117.1 hypothetical protein L202_06049 [Cryptococcus amylolentus CBS 6039]